MALYRRGTASMDADGTVHGTDTKWKDQLALIRVGATIVFLEQPIKLAVISDIVSDTELKAISTDGQTASDGKYVILLNDSLTVNGLAQNVAETLRYYQSKETEIAAAIDLINQLDMNKLEQIVADVNKAKSDSQAAQNQAELARDAANAARDETNSIKNQTQQIVDSAVGGINAAKDQAITDIGSKESSVISHIDTEEASAIQAINDAKGDLSVYVNDAQTAAQTATSAKNDAQAARDDAVRSKDAASVSAQEAKDAANSINADNLLTKDGNLSGLVNKKESRKNIGLGENDAVNFLTINTTGAIGAGRNSWDGSNWGSQSILSSLMIMSPDGVSEPGIYVRKKNGSDGYAGTLLFYEYANYFETNNRFRSNQFLCQKTTMGYNQMWSASCFQGNAFTADSGAENYQSLVAGSCDTRGQGYVGGVAFGMMTTGNPEWPRAQISVGAQDRDGAGNIGLQMHFRFMASGQISYAGPQGAGSFQQVPASDRNIKHSIKDDESSIAYNNIKSMRFRNFIFNDDEQERVRRGVIAQEIEEIDNLYVKRRLYESHELNGPKVERLELDTTPLLLDTMRALQDTIKKVEELQEEIKMLKSK
ncbi:putative tail fiber [Shigella phage Shfl1]|uniref:Putative tail fiber n=1 Tax=Shigella phage Shfl1 TaxID=2919551 RepID=F2VX06_9CAUD|nr:tail fiber protein [Shigella phage Shfl1]AEA72934.1 putative tail fiber [Shigella phage Shfl1]